MATERPEVVGDRDGTCDETGRPRLRASRFSFVALLALLLAAPAFGAQTPPARPASPARPDYSFASGAGILLFYVNPDKVTDFEGVMRRLRELLERSSDPGRRQQVAAWRFFRSTETPREAVVYVLLFDPAIAGVDYDPVKLLSEAPEAEAQTLYDRLRADVVRVERMGVEAIK